MNPLRLGSLVLLLLLAQGKEKAPVKTPVKNPVKNPVKTPVKANDQESIDTLVDALYDVISGPKGAQRDWKRFASLFHDGARLQALALGRDGKRRFITMTPADYIKRSGKWAETNGLFEKETHRSQDVYGHIAQVFSSYELRIGSAKKDADLTGINSIQCCQVEGKWRILSILWEDARSAGPIPVRYQPSKKDIDDRK